MELFDSTKRSLYSILQDVNNGKIQLPDFQRGWIWDDFRIKGLLASIAKSFPIGAIMLLENGNPNIRLKTRPIESVKLDDKVKIPEELILDGQQRITSLYQTIISNSVVETKNEKGHKISRWYYIDMKKALDTNTDLEEAIISLNEKKQITRNFGREIILDLSAEQYEFEELMYPVWMVDEYSEWRIKFEEYHDYDKGKIKFINEFEKKIIKNFENYQVPVIFMKKENSKEAVCQVFEKVNTGGVSLNVFELLTATFASDSFNLRDNWESIKKDLMRKNVLSKTENTDFLQAVTLLSTYKRRLKLKSQNISEERLPAVTCKRKDVLALTLDDYLENYESIKYGFIKAAQLLIENDIYSARDLPYTTQMIPLSAIFAVLKNETENIAVKNKLMQWYWCGVLGELYGGANESRYAVDLPQVVDWIHGKIEEPKTIFDANFNPSRLHSLRTRNSAAYKGINTLLMKNGAQDFISGQPITLTNYFTDAIDIHHIFPRYWCEIKKNNIPRNDYDCIINKTPISARTNRIIGGNAPSKYLKLIENEIKKDKLGVGQVLKTHLINPDFIYADDFYAFFKARKMELLRLIGDAMGKTIDITSQVEEPESDDFEEDLFEDVFDDSIPED
jgi:hypothetical protein